MIQPLKNRPLEETKIHYIFEIKYVNNPTSSSILKSAFKQKSHINYSSLTEIHEQTMLKSLSRKTDNEKKLKSDSSQNQDLIAPSLIQSPSTSPSRSFQPSTHLQIVQNLIEEPIIDIPRTFSYTLVFKDCKFNQKPSSGIWQVRYVN